MQTVHALLVGINAYVNIKPLRGCVDDIRAIEALLTARVGDALRLRTLLDGDATRDAIIAGFTDHLTQAKPDDIALFYFCGHGSQEPCPAEWMEIEPNGKNQTIVPVDARANGVFDIADKELVALIARVADTGAQVVTIFDSCHSGGVTRDGDDDPMDSAATRMAPASKGPPRTLATYLDRAVELFEPSRVKVAGVPDPSHIAIAACQKFETAKEWPLEAPRRGAFTVAVEEVLKSLGPSATYLDLLRSVRTKVRDRTKEQVPLITVGGKADGAMQFLGGQVGRRDFTVDITASSIWLSAGTADGIGEPTAGASTEIAIHRRGAFDVAGATPVPVATATVTEAMVDRSRIRLDGTAVLDPALSYIGVITRLAVPQRTVAVTGSPDSLVTLVRTTLATRSGVYVLADTPMDGVPSITARVSDIATELLDAAGNALANQRFTHDATGQERLTKAVLHLAQFYGIRDRTPVTSSFNDAVTIGIVPVAEGETQIPLDRPALPITKHVTDATGAGDAGVRCRYRLQNTSAKDLYVVLLVLSEEYDSDIKFDDWIPAGRSVWAREGKIQRLKVPAWKGPDAKQSVDLFKVFAAITPINATELALDSLLYPKPPAATTDALRAAEEEGEETQDSSFWGTTTLTVITHRA